jgi:xylulokinase
MLCALADGLNAVTRLGVTAERILLIGGAAQNPAVQHIATRVFPVPVDVPEPGEYVAAGAARQAGWALTGTLPEWSTPIAAHFESNYDPAVIGAYRSHRA